ncbi:MAG: hypothetical protein WKF93_02200 [Acidimicrobiales bacterium]
MRCEDVAELLPAAADGIVPGGLRGLARSPGVGLEDRSARRHVEHCVRCQAELVQYRRLLRTLHGLRTEVLEPAPGLLADILATLEAAGERQAVRSLLTGRRVAYVGGIAAAATAGAAGAILLATRTRRRPLAS